jgi:DNA-binding response OmpR family regulator
MIKTVDGRFMGTGKILVIEDDLALANVVEYNLSQAGYEVTLARDGLLGLRAAQANPPDLVLLDLMLPGADGLEVCRQLRADPKTSRILILMLTAKAEEADQVIGFNAGADDYVTKPFSVRVVLERVKALLRRAETNESPTDFVECQGIAIDRVRHVAAVGDRNLDLTPTEFRILDSLLRNPGRVYSRDELIMSAMPKGTIVLERTIDVHVRALRKKLGSFADRVETVRGIGYRFRIPVAV